MEIAKLRKGMAAVLAVLALVPVSLGQATATIRGTIYDPDGKGAPGFRAVLKEIATGREYVSAASGAGGAYSLSVPIGSRFELVGVVAPDGYRLSAQQIAPLPVRFPETYTLDVVFEARPATAPAAAAPDEAQPPVPPAPVARTAWWKNPLAIAGLAVGAGGLAALAANANDDEPTSPSHP